nr:uncharacterized protein LOC109191526 [Ipomoea trifida]
MSEADILKPTACQSLNTIDGFQTRERRAEEENKPSDGSRDGAELPVVKPEVEQLKVSRSNSAPSTSERVRDATAELPVGEEGEKPKNKRRRTKKATPRFPVLDSEKVKRRTYQVKASAAPIFEKHGDIAANYPYPSRGFRASVFEVICDVIRQLRTNDWGTIVSMVGQMRTEISDTAAAAHLEVSRLKQILDDIPIRNTSLVSKAARKDLTQRKAKLVTRRPKDSLSVLNRVNEQEKGQSRVRENNGIVRVHCEDSGKELFAEKSQWCRSEPSH